MSSICLSLTQTHWSVYHVLTGWVWQWMQDSGIWKSWEPSFGETAAKSIAVKIILNCSLCFFCPGHGVCMCVQVCVCDTDVSWASSSRELLVGATLHCSRGYSDISLSLSLSKSQQGASSQLIVIKSTYPGRSLTLRLHIHVSESITATLSLPPIWLHIQRFSNTTSFCGCGSTGRFQLVLGIENIQ